MAELHIQAIGALGDGVAKIGKDTVFVARTIAGETVRASGNTPNLELVEVVKSSPDRVEPPCPQFETCGGCSLQHLATPAYLSWKRGLVENAFLQAGIDVKVDPCISTPANSRRRVSLSAKREGNDIALGFHRRNSHDLVDISSCAIMLPNIEAALQALRDLLASVIKGKEEVQVLVTAANNGMDLDFTLPEPLNETMTASFVRSFARAPFLRASINREVVAEQEKPFVQFGAAKVALPPGGFLQAVAQAEQEMAAMVCDHLKKSKRVADLFCGSGTFALRLAEHAHVHGVEVDIMATEAVKGAKSDGKLKPVTVINRDLHQLPLTVSELKPFDGLCLDPPRAGAELQIREIAKSSITKVAYVSCNATTLARDAAHLINGGFKLNRIVPVDQFVFSHHVEVVALFSKTAGKNKKPIFARR